MEYVNIDFSNIEKFVTQKDIAKHKKTVEDLHADLEKTIKNEDNMVGWINYHENISDDEIEKIKTYAQEIDKKSQVLLVIGIGGSYLGAKAVIDILNTKKENASTTEVVFVGHTISEYSINKVLEHIKDKDFSINVISKSGKTLETAVTYRIFRKYLEFKYGLQEAEERTCFTTSKNTGVLRFLAQEEGHNTLYIPENIGGRYSVVSSVGLLPIAVAGFDIDEFLDGMKFAHELYFNSDIDNNDAYKYAIVRHVLNEHGKDIENISVYEEYMLSFVEWIKQLFAESEGKQGKGVMPIGTMYSTDLHSLGQYIQEGKRNIFETVLNVIEGKNEFIVPDFEKDYEGLNYLSKTSLGEINKYIMQATTQAHVEGGVPVITINIPTISCYYVARTMYMFEMTIMMSCYLKGLDPFNQPGVEAYKNNLKTILEGLK